MTNPFSSERTHPLARAQVADVQMMAIDAIGFFEWHRAEGTLTWSRGSALRLGNVPSDDLYDFERWADYVSGADLSALRAEFDRAEQSGDDRVTFRCCFHAPDGRLLRLQGMGLCWYNDALKLEKVSGVLLDITGQANEAQALARNEAQLRTIFATAPDAAIVIDASGIITGFNAAASRMFGISAQEAVGGNVSRLMPEEMASRHDAVLASYIGGQPARMIGRTRQLTGKRGDGSEFPIELNVGEVKLEDATIFVAFIRDLTVQFEAGQRIEELREQFLRTSRLNVMGTVAAGLAHELNQPLAASSNFLAAARLMMPDRPDVGEMLQQAADQVQLAGDIIRRLRGFLAPGGIHTERVAVAALVEQARALALFGRARFETYLVCEIEPGTEFVMVDRVQLLQVLVNLIRNAAGAFAANSSGDTITISTHPAGERVQISVTDNGPGFPGELLARADPIFRSSRTDGMGLGLTLCRRIVEGWGGTLELFNGQHGGAVIRFSVPLAKPSTET